MELKRFEKQYQAKEEIYGLIMNAESNLTPQASNKKVNFSDCPCPCPPVARAVIYVTFSPVM